ncbi:outer membrane protein [Phyllobacterium myrsinacearum]|uniref:Porin family protein n=1 Tax=Phyllobacterium myrsinacearum TaxID=28101 RepID=A0A2S9JPT5_9HYPH|nr:outer membrane protein [Phyllobacterium myrsinacearum]PRD55195.1 porin family protein [Phyllobacterium myrsinacearum]PWV89185.1 outer membrane immunogenic protein [Phyllobacterium myrsinacearum]RZV05576.1 outer membrane immunogenic protein [Phyllobacterium myrsinacearum]
MQKFGPIGLFFAAAVLSGNAYAADAVTDTAPPEAVFTAPAFTWTGFYAGVNAGYAFSGNDRVGFRERGNFLGSIGTLEDNGFLGGAQVGYNYQINNFVLGLEADFQGGDISDSISGPLGNLNFNAHSKIDWFGTVRPRLGYAFDRTMIYGTGGLAYGNVKYSISDNVGNAASESKTRAGWVAGAGIEHAFTDHLTAKLEYQYINLGTHTVGNDFISTDATSDFHSVRVGLNYKF